MRILGWVASILCLLAMLVVLTIGLFSLAGSYQATIWFAASLIFLVLLFCVVNPAVRSSTNIGKLAMPSSLGLAVVAFILAILFMCQGFYHVEDSESDDSDDGSANSTASAPPKPTPANLSYFECGIDKKNDRRIMELGKLDDGTKYQVINSKGLTVYGYSVKTAFVLGEDPAAIFSSASVDDVAKAINKRLGGEACQLDKTGTDRQCYVNDTPIGDRDVTYTKMFLGSGKDGAITLKCLVD